MIDARVPLQLATISLKNFRCFDGITFDLDSPIILICGANGTGKTSLLEALYYACYLKSFRTNLSRDIVALEHDSFFIKLLIRESSIDHTISIGVSKNKRLVKIDNQSVISYKNLLGHYRIISITEDDLMIIKGGPEERRIFVDQAVFLCDQSFSFTMREYKAVLSNRNSFLYNQQQYNEEMYDIVTQQLWSYTQKIQHARKSFLQQLEDEIKIIIAQYFNDDFLVTFVYQAKKQSDRDFEEFWSNGNALQLEEIRFGKSLFGAHLDDVDVVFAGKRSRIYASRGQQKLVLLLIKIAQMRLIARQKGPGIFLLDDFMTDFDPARAQILLSILLELGCQLIFTSPCQDSAIELLLAASGSSHKIISI